MEVTVSGKCYDGIRSKSLSGIVSIVEDLPQVINGQRFMNKVTRAGKRLNDPKVKSMIGYTFPIMLLAGGLPPFGLTRALAAPVSDTTAITAVGIPTGIKESILHSFDPLIDLIVTLAYPIAGVMIAGGCLFIMCGNREKGMSMLQNAAIGYILVQLSPMMLKLLVGIGGSVA
jgi:hypothetical protein